MRFRLLTALGLAAAITGLAGCKQEAPPNQAAAPPGPGKPQPAPNPAELKPVPNPAEPKPAEPKPAPVAFPELGPSRLIKPGIRFQEVTLQRGAVPMRVWFYRPEKAAGKLPLVLVPPAGSPLVIGMELADGDRPEHYPYARAGFAVASFEIDGHVPNLRTAPDAALFKGAREFRDARAGLDNARAALDFILAKVPEIDTARVYIAGHSSAATLALLAAEHEPRIKACAAFAPVTDVEASVAAAIPQLEKAIPGFGEFIRFSSPKTAAEKLKCPVFLFHARDDGTVPLKETTTFAALLKRTNPRVTVAIVNTGGHYESMIREGTPQAIRWFQKLAKKGG